MKITNQIFLIILFTVFLAYQTMSQNVSNVTGPNPVDSIVSNQELIDTYKKTTVYIKNHWYLTDKLTGQPIFMLHVSKKDLVNAGIKYSSEEFAVPVGDKDAVPVYVKTADGYEPLLTGEEGKYNLLVSGIMSGRGSIVTTDGFVLTTRRVVSPWNSPIDFGKAYPRGILISADLKQVLDSNVPPPKNFIPTKSRNHSGMLTKFNIRIKNSGEYSFRVEKLEATMAETFKTVNASLVQNSTRHDAGLIKMEVSEVLNKAKILDNYDLLKKDENLFFITQDPSVNPPSIKLLALPFSITDFVRAEGENSDVISMSDNLENSPTVSKAGAQIQRSYFGFYSYSGTPFFNKQGKLVGIYSSYDPATNRHYMVPIRYGMEFFDSK